MLDTQSAALVLVLRVGLASRHNLNFQAFCWAASARASLDALSSPYPPRSQPLLGEWAGRPAARLVAN
eukprot:2238777-Pyramimonas_sp.AAC.1